MIKMIPNFFKNLDMLTGYCDSNEFGSTLNSASGNYAPFKFSESVVIMCPIDLDRYPECISPLERIAAKTDQNVFVLGCKESYGDDKKVSIYDDELIYNIILPELGSPEENIKTLRDTCNLNTAYQYSGHVFKMPVGGFYVIAGDMHDDPKEYKYFTNIVSMAEPFSINYIDPGRDLNVKSSELMEAVDGSLDCKALLKNIFGSLMRTYESFTPEWMFYSDFKIFGTSIYADAFKNTYSSFFTYSGLRNYVEKNPVRSYMEKMLDTLRDVLFMKSTWYVNRYLIDCHMDGTTAGSFSTKVFFMNNLRGVSV